jgi:hypothetical protein
MNENVGTQLSALAEQWRGRARTFMHEAEQSRLPADMIRLTAMASALEWAAGDLLWVARSPQTVRASAAGDDSNSRSG